MISAFPARMVKFGVGDDERGEVGDFQVGHDVAEGVDLEHDAFEGGAVDFRFGDAETGEIFDGVAKGGRLPRFGEPCRDRRENCRRETYCSPDCGSSARSNIPDV